MAKKKASKTGNYTSWRGISPKALMLTLLIAIPVCLACFWLQHSGLLQSGQDNPSLRISEVMSDNCSALISDDGNAYDWIEITNTGSDKINLKGYALALSSLVNDVYVFPDLDLAPGAYTVVYADKKARGTDAAPFGLPASGNETLLLLNRSGAVIDSVELPRLAQDTAYALISGNEWKETVTSTPGSANNAATSIDPNAKPETVTDVISMTEVMTRNSIYAPAADGSHSDYIELYNASAEPVDLTDWALSDDPAKLKKWKFRGTVIQPNAYLLVRCQTASDTSDPDSPVADLKLSSDGETLYLTRPDGNTVDIVSVPALHSDQAYSYVDGAWTTNLAPTPGQSNTLESAASINSGIFTGTLRITEISAAPTDADYDWLELYNGSGETVDLSLYGLSDDSKKPRKYQFPSGTAIGPGEYKIVCLSGKDDNSIGGYVNAHFALSKEGGYTITIASPDGTLLDAVYVPEQYKGMSYARVPGTSQWQYYETASFTAAAPGNGKLGRAPIPVCSVDGGLYKSGDTFTVELSAPAGCSIYYTLDSSEPTNASNLYTGPITISETTILRSRVYREGYLESYIDTHSYLYDVQTQDGVYIVSLVSDVKNLTDEETGMMVRGNGETPNYNNNWEREGSIEIFTSDGTRVVGSECGLALHGIASRGSRIKSFNVIARSEYGNDRFEYPIFSERDYSSYGSLLLRPSGEDFNISFMRDTLLTSLMKDTSLLYQKWELSVCYIDGYYYTLYYIRERLTPETICKFEGWEGMEDEIDVARGEGAVHGSNKTYEELLKYVTANDTSDDAVFSNVESAIDVDNYIEYMSIEIFSGNADLLNCRRYRNPATDGKWRWALYDLDWAFASDNDSIASWLDPAGAGVQKATDTRLFIACMKNAGFRDRFLTYFGEMMATRFSAEYVVARIEERQALLADLLPAYCAKWNLKTLGEGAEALKAYAKERPIKLLKTYFPNALHMTQDEINKYFGAAIQAAEKYSS